MKRIAQCLRKHTVRSRLLVLVLYVVGVVGIATSEAEAYEGVRDWDIVEFKINDQVFTQSFMLDGINELNCTAPG